MMNLKTVFLTLGLVALCATGVQANTTETIEKVCSTDSYGNTTCSDKVTNVTTGEISYVNKVTTKEVEILNTSVPSMVPVLASSIVALGGLSLYFKKRQ